MDAANPRPENAFGHIIEIAEAGGDFAATSGTWEILLQCGDPSVAEVGATFSSDTTANGWFGMPDNCAVDAEGRLWVSTDGQGPGATGRTDGLWAVDTEGEARATSKLFFRVPVGAEMCGPLFTPDMETMFLAVQHPADGGTDWEPFGRPSYFEDLSTRWPDFQDGMPIRPSVRRHHQAGRRQDRRLGLLALSHRPGRPEGRPHLLWAADAGRPRITNRDLTRALGRLDSRHLLRGGLEK